MGESKYVPSKEAEAILDGYRLLDDNFMTLFFDQNFEYKIGQEIVPHNKNMGLFCVTESDIQRCPYRDAKDAVLIRLRVDSMDDILLSRGINQYIEVRLNRCVVDGIVDSKTE